MNVVRNQKAGAFRRKEIIQPLNFEVRGDTENADKVINKQLMQEINLSTGNNTTTSSESHVVLALTEGRGQARGEVGIAAIDLQAPVLILSQLSDGVHYTDTINKIMVLNPSKILIPDTICEQNPLPKIVEVLRENLLTATIIPIQRRHFNDKFGLEQISNLCSSKSFNIIQIIARKYYCLSAASALLSYLKNITLMTFAQNCLKIDYQTKGGMMIDTQTSTRLELLYSLNVESTAARKFSLYSMLNKCETRIGQRHLRANILEPSCDVDFIHKRQEQIKFFMANDEFHSGVKENLQNFRNVETLLKVSCITPSNNPEKALQSNIDLALLLKNSLESVKPLAEVIVSAFNPSFEEPRQLLSSTIFNDIIEQIDNVIQPNIHENRMAKKFLLYLYAVKAGVDETVDFLRKLYAETVERINAYVDDIRENCLMSLKTIFSVKLGYHMVGKNPNNASVPSTFEVIYKKGQNIYLTTPDLIALNETLQLISKDIIRISNSILCEKLLNIAKEIDFIYYLISIIIEFDIVQSLAIISGSDGYSCPTFSRVLRLEEAFHPMLRMSQNREEAVCNNVIATPQYNFYLLTGPNMSGKTIYIKMIAVIQVMAQLGCFVPAKVATLRMSDKIFSRLGFSDNIEQNASSFTVELRDMEYIYSNLTPNSLVVIDELCRSTDPQEGELLCYSFCEKLLNFVGVSYDDYFKALRTDNEELRDSSQDENESRSRNTTRSLAIKGSSIKLKDIARPFIFLTTHFSDMTKITEKYHNAINLHMVVKQKEVPGGASRLEFKYRIQSGPSPMKNYGLALARALRFPSSMLDRADELITKVEDDSVLPFMNERHASNEDGDVTMTEATTQGLNDLEKDVIDLYSYVLLLMSTENDQKLDYISIDIVNDKLRALIEAMTPALREMIEKSSLEEIIFLLNSSKSSNDTFSQKF